MAMKAELLKEWVNALDNDADVVISGEYLMTAEGQDGIGIGSLSIEFDDSPGTFDVGVSRVCCHSHTYRIKAESPEEAERIGLERAQDDDAHNWAADWREAQVNTVERVEEKEA